MLFFIALFVLLKMFWGDLSVYFETKFAADRGMQVFQNLLVPLFFFLRFALYKKYPVALKGHLILKKNSVVFQINESLIKNLKMKGFFV